MARIPWNKGLTKETDHIKSMAIIIKENNLKTIIEARICKDLWDHDNGMTLCEECHKLTDNYRGRGHIGDKNE